MTLQEVKKQTVDILSLKDTIANPAPLGLLCFIRGNAITPGAISQRHVPSSRELIIT
jgi:hypothetical protein